MAAVLEGDKKIKRLVRVHGIGPLEVTIEEAGISFRIPKTRTYIRSTWTAVVQACGTDTNVPSYLMGRPFQLLEHCQKKREKKI